MAEYRLAPVAEHDLESIWGYTVRESGIEQVTRYFDEVTAAFTALASSPQAAPSYEHIRRGYRRWRVERHLLYFRDTDSRNSVGFPTISPTAGR